MVGVDYVFCAAALKQVPSCEFFPIEAVKTNVLGVDNTIRAAIKNMVQRVVVLSTDKAVYPVNAMGMSKALAEKTAIALACHEQHTTIIVTRYGNVMGTRGSVIPLFVDQILKGQCLTVTDPHMTRFMMSLDEAVDLVFYAFANGQGGDLFVRKSPASTIGDIVDTLKYIFDYKKHVDVIGPRAGEKIHEVLVSKEEIIRSVDIGDYLQIHSNQLSMDYDSFFKEGDQSISRTRDYTSDGTQQLSANELHDKLVEMDIIQRALKGEPITNII
jgi:UDP-glucose 4-epimerase